MFLSAGLERKYEHDLHDTWWKGDARAEEVDLINGKKLFSTSVNIAKKDCWPSKCMCSASVSVVMVLVMLGQNLSNLFSYLHLQSVSHFTFSSRVLNPLVDAAPAPAWA